MMFVKLYRFISIDCSTRYLFKHAFNENVERTQFGLVLSPHIELLKKVDAKNSTGYNKKTVLILYQVYKI